MLSSKILNFQYYNINFLSKRYNSLICVNNEVRQALFEKKGVVALESTIITHGMKFPENYKTVMSVQNRIREETAIPATIAVIKGKVKVGLTDLELQELSENQKNCLKISRRDYPFAISKKLTGGTTVSGTMLIAHKVGIPIFVTGGIGGVHREGESTMDISADLTELGRTPVAVISSGIKSILDIGRTLEYLETQGVAVATYGSSKVFPAFFCRKSNFESPYNLLTESEAAEFIQSIFNLELGSGILIGVPIPKNDSLNETDILNAIEEGIVTAKKKNIKGKEITPFLLSHISSLTKGKSLAANMALINNNAAIGSKIAVELSKLRLQNNYNSNTYFSKLNCDSVFNECCFGNSAKSSEKFSAVVIGGSNVDLVVNIKDDDYKPKAVFFTCIDSRMIPTRFTETCVGDMFVVRNAGNVIPHSRFYPDEITTNEPAALELGCVINDIRHIIVCGHSDCKMDGRTVNGIITQSGGGVARNIADALGKLETSAFLISAVGEDESKESFIYKTNSHLNQEGISKIKNARTGTCMVLCDRTGECLLAVGDMNIHHQISIKEIEKHKEIIINSSLVVIDGNLSQTTLEHIMELCRTHSIPVWFEPTDIFRASKPFNKKTNNYPTFISPNYQEFLKIYKTLFPNGENLISENSQNSIVEDCIWKGYKVGELIDNLIITLGKEGVLIINKSGENDSFYEITTTKSKYIKKKGKISHRLYKPKLLENNEIVNVSGAGDCFAGGFISAMLDGQNEKSCVKLGFKCCIASLKSSKAVPSMFS